VLQAAIDSYPMATPPTPLNLAYMKRMQDTLGRQGSPVLRL